MVWFNKYLEKWFGFTISLTEWFGFGFPKFQWFDGFWFGLRNRFPSLVINNKIPQFFTINKPPIYDRRLKVKEIAEIMNMSKERVCHILNQHLDMRKLSARWVPRLLTLDQKLVRIKISNALLAQFGRNKSEFWRRLITVGETWIHHYTPETKIQSKQRTAKGEPAPKKSKNCIFGWESDGDYFLGYS